jgi:diacylglycerol kinase (ATP)
MDPTTDLPRWPVTIGAVGLGSSNDFHKPRKAAHDVLGVPIALDVATSTLVDLGRVDFVTPDGTERTEYFVLNSSLGAVAEGNARYNQPRGLLRVLKGVSVWMAIQWCSLETLLAYKNLPATVEVDGKAVDCQTITSLGVIKRVHFAGDMRYDTPVMPADGLFDVNLCADMQRGELVRAMLAIMSGRFLAAKLPKTHHWRATRVRVVPTQPAALELDGEVRLVKAANFRLIPRAIRLCGPVCEQ